MGTTSRRDMTTGSTLTFGKIASAMDEFVKSNGWYGVDSRRPQTPRNLAMSLAIESAELLECFQWAEHADLSDVADEIADVILYTVQLARVTGVDVEKAVTDKLHKNLTRRWDEK